MLKRWAGLAVIFAHYRGPTALELVLIQVVVLYHDVPRVAPGCIPDYYARVLIVVEEITHDPRVGGGDDPDAAVDAGGIRGVVAIDPVALEDGTVV